MKRVDQFDEICRARPLTSEEADELARVVQREPHKPIYRRWTYKDDQSLLKAARKRGGVKEYAELEKRTYASAQSRLIKLKRERRERGVVFAGRFYYDGEQ